MTVRPKELPDGESLVLDSFFFLLLRKNSNLADSVEVYWNSSIPYSPNCTFFFYRMVFIIMQEGMIK
jgi:hypothetical protein